MITSLPDVRNDFTDVNDAVNAGLSCCLPGSEIFMIRDVDNIIYSLGVHLNVCGVREYWGIYCTTDWAVHDFDNTEVNIQ
jgi:hypothetical protein